MCGIAGMVTLVTGEETSSEIVGRMTDTMVHRGPDGRGTWMSADRRVAFGHRRLAIVDLTEAGAQPMTNLDGSVVVTFNGEIYNFLELRRRLESDGCRFRSHSDTEVLVYLYEKHGEAMVEMLDGDFAFAIWNARTRRLFLARDRAGVKPLYYTQTGNRFLFASEIRALVEGCPAVPGIDDESLYHYLTYLVVPAPRTLLKGVRKLPPAGAMTVDLSGETATIREWQFWKPLPGQFAVDRNRMDEQLAELFGASVRKRLMSDVPVGVLFSGGVDSTLNALHFQKLIAPQRVRTFFVGMPGVASVPDETAWARKMAAQIGTEHHEVLIDERDMLETAAQIAHYQDEPLSDPVCVPLFFVARLARSTGTIVLHAGEGADETFCGYDNYRKFLRYHDQYWQRFAALPRAIGTLGHRMFSLSSAPRHQKVADAFRRQSRRQPFFLGGAIAYYETEKRSVLSPGFLERSRQYDSADIVTRLWREIEEARPDATFLQKMTFVELQLRLPELLLMRVDKMTMAHSIEVRVPFLDRDLVDFALSVPEEFKLRDGVSKEPVKRLAAAGVGRDAVYRKKTGFGAPIQEWFRNELGAEMRSLLRTQSAEWEGTFSLAALRSRLDRGPASVNEAFQLWVVYNLMSWHDGMRRLSSAA